MHAVQRGHVRAQLADTYCLPWLSHWSPCQVTLQLLDEIATKNNGYLELGENGSI